MDFNFLSFFSYAAPKTIWSQYSNENNVLPTNPCPFIVLPQTLSCLYSNEIKGFEHRSEISQGTAGPSSGVPFHSFIDPENRHNAYYVSSRAILEKPRFSHVDRRVAMKITVLPLWVTLNGLWTFMVFSHFSEFRILEKNKENQEYHFRTGISTVLSSWAPPLHTIFHWNLERNSLRTHLRKTCLFRNIAKTNEIATFRPPRLDITTSRFFACSKTTSLLNTQEKTSKSITSQKTI